jgi:hypothetical protein
MFQAKRKYLFIDTNGSETQGQRMQHAQTNVPRKSLLTVGIPVDSRNVCSCVAVGLQDEDGNIFTEWKIML